MLTSGRVARLSPIGSPDEDVEPLEVATPAAVRAVEATTAPAWASRPRQDPALTASGAVGSKREAGPALPGNVCMQRGGELVKASDGHD